MFHCFDRFKRLFGRRAADVVNAHSAFLNNICGGEGIVVERPDVPSADDPPRISLRADHIRQILETVRSDVSSTSAKALTDCRDQTSSIFPNGTLKTDTWSVGELTGGKPRGVSLTVFTRFVNVQNALYYLIYRTLEFDADGRLISVSKENGGVAVSIL